MPIICCWLSGLRIEWCKGKAQADRWQEEVELLQEERRRILAFFEYRASEWEKKGGNLNTEGDAWMLPNVPYDAVAIAGREAYARQQAHQFRLMRNHFLSVWANVDKYHSSNGQDKSISILPSNIVLQEIEDDKNVPIPTHTMIFFFFIFVERIGIGVSPLRKWK